MHWSLTTREETKRASKKIILLILKKIYLNHYYLNYKTINVGNHSSLNCHLLQMSASIAARVFVQKNHVLQFSLIIVFWQSPPS